MTWNNEKELVYQGSVLHGLNIGDLLLDTLSNRKKTISPNLFRNAFSKGLNDITCLLYTSPSPRDKRQSRMPSSA